MSREIGSLRALSNGESQYVGSSSGVFFINTVRRAFSTAAAATVIESSQQGSRPGQPLANPSPEDCIVGEEQAEPDSHTHVSSREPNGHPYQTALEPSIDSPWDIGRIDYLRKLPEYAVARQLVMTYFRIWHPLVPFLHGPACLEALDALYSDGGSEQARRSQSLSQVVMFRCIFDISSLERPDLSLGSTRRCTPAQLMPALGLLALKCDITSIQALLSAQVYFVATMSLRNASTIGGLVSKSIVQSGLHRCPHRYGHLTPDDRSMRKRVFWSAYVLDRFLSQSLGHPNGIQDSDIDVCPPGSRDLHEPVMHSSLSPSSPSGADTILHLPMNHPERRAASPHRHGSKESSAAPEETTTADDTINQTIADARPAEPAAVTQHRQQVQAVLASHVRYSQHIGRMLEIFHKSIHVREADGRAVLFLKADLGAWGNNLVQPRSDNSSSQHDPEILALGPDPTVFPFISYQYSLLLVNRPSLSLDPDSADFHAAIQACVAAGTTIIRTMETQSQNGYPLFWPGYMSAVWMSGLVLAFAYQLRMHSAANAISGISSALKLLTTMTNRWRMALHCKSVLSTLLASIEAKAAKRKRSRWEDEPPPSSRSISRTKAALSSRNSSGQHQDGPGPSKRRSTGLRKDAYPHQNPASPFSQDPSAQPQDFSPQPNLSSIPPASIRSAMYAPYPPDPQRGPEYPGTWRESAEGPGAALDDPNGLYAPRFYDHAYPTRLDYSFSPMRADPGNSFVPYQRQHFMPIPTTFPDRRGSRPYPNMTQADGSVFDVFDGATWGSLLDLVDNPNGEPLL